ncbi:iron complex outermembrane receptor protein [Novosphingobium sp. Rr 2-17]|uniref:TonB-dependent receptor n=1 Tax=Novosphingobium sp. Rr 2-17 TaxID=555793 RepID=UPI0002698E75|nr:TonB-dependent receptor [Novosphingobium sp. Rr 2-17]EIZ80945.1 iron complex outermembrane receptor protein [Novosphingobium sp. Rr 2-17]
MSIKSSKAAHTFLALSCIVPAFATVAHAQETEQAERNLGGATVTDSAITEPAGGKLESPKRTRSVRDTPQTITVLSSQVLEQQNLLSLRDALSTVPGITFGAGEGGGGYGDSITFRGYSANNDITIDGVRDSAQYTRSDSFNIEQIEVTNGANSVVAGSGSVGGSINLVSKRPKPDDAFVVTGGIGTANYYRGTADLNKRVNDLIAFRLNGMWHRNDVPGRDVEFAHRWGVAPAVTIGVDGPTKMTIQYLHQEDNNIPQYGVPYVDGIVEGADRSSYYGYRNIDRQKINLDQLTSIFEHEFSDTLSIRNLARWQDTRQYTLVDPPQGTYCKSNGQTASATSTACSYPGYYQPSGPRGNTRHTENQLMFDQFDLMAKFNTGNIEHTIDLGAAASWEQYNLSSGNSLRNADGTSVTLPLINIDNPNDVVTGASGYTYGSNVYTGPINYIESSRVKGEQTNVAAYLFDTMKLGKFELNAGARLERNTGSYRSDTVSTATATLGQVTRGTTYENKATLFSYRVGLVYKPVEAVSLYAAYGNSRTPSKSSVNGSCTTATCNVDPESARNYEIGAKAELFNGGLLATIAAFRNERNKYAVASNDPTVPDQQLDGRSRVNGIAVGLSGKITEAWSITANYTYLDSKLIQSVSDFCLNNPGEGTCTNSAANPNPGGGSALTQTPKHAASLFTSYRLPFGLTIGYGATYQGKAPLNTPSASSPKVYYINDYLVHNAMLSYDFTRNLSAQINVKNFTDKLYYTRVRNNGWATPGDARSAILTITAKM